jgi:ferredoxin--NADP+ reductase
VAKFRIAIIGAGPAGYFAAQALQSAELDGKTFAIDMIEKLPTPWGLVRSGVAPDHPKIKSVSKVFEKIATQKGFRLIGNVELGRDISLKELEELYDAVIIATGSTVGRKLGIPGEELANSISAADFVPWYNAHPEYKNLEVDFSDQVAVVIGAGNVAIDVARMLALNPKELDPTDTAQYALDKLHNSAIRQVHLFGRRGPEHAAFTSPELRELPKLEFTDVFIDEAEISSALSRAESQGEIVKDLKLNLEVMSTMAKAEKKGVERKIFLHFLATPLEIKGKERVEEIVFSINEVKDGKVVPSGQTKSIKCGLVITAIGYQCLEMPGLIYESGKIKNTNGRIDESNTYVVGWAKRGPIGVIGTNKSDSSDVIKLLISNLTSPKSSQDILEILRSRDITIISQKGWEQINHTEEMEGKAQGKTRVKIVSIDRLIEVGSFLNQK